jgi:hypothetical protein
MARAIVVGGLLVALAGSSAAGAVAYRFQADQAEYLVEPGSLVQVECYLYESLTEGSPSRLVAENGLAGVDVALSVIDGSTPGLAEPQSGELAAGFDDDLLNEETAEYLIGYRGFGNTEGVLPEQVDADTWRVAIGTFTLQASTEWNHTTVLELGDYSAGPGLTETTGTWDVPGDSLDTMIDAGQFEITVIPCPPALVALCGALPLLLRRKSRCGSW